MDNITARPQTVARQRAWRMTALLAALLVLWKAGTFLLPAGGDGGVFLNMGRGLVDGLLPYRDLWDHKPPGIYVANALAIRLFGASIQSARVVEVAWVVATGLLLLRLTRRMFDPAVAWASAMLGMLVANSLVLTEGGNFTETYTLLGSVLAYLAYERFVSGGSLRALVLSGIGAGLAFQFKQTQLVVLLALASFTLLLMLRRVVTPRAGLGGLLCLLVGFALALLPAPLLFWRQGALADYASAVFGYNLGYAQATGLGEALKNVQDLILVQVLPIYLPLLGLALLGLVYALRVAPTAQSLWLAWIWGWALAGALLGFRFYRHYCIQFAPETALLAGLGLQWLLRSTGFRWREAQPAARTAIAVLGMTLCLPLLLGQVSTGLAGVVSPEASRTWNGTIGRYLAQHTGPDETIYVWGQQPEIYVAAGRRSASRFHYKTPLLSGATAGAWQGELMAALEARPPAYIVLLDEGGPPPPELPELQRYLEAHYHPETTLHYAAIYRRN
jgi:hypothetical protein